MASTQPSIGFYEEKTCNLGDFAALTAQTLAREHAPQATYLEKNVPIYDMAELYPILENPAARRALMAEWANIFLRSSGVIVLKNAFEDTRPLDIASDIFRNIITQEKAQGASQADHFAACDNDRIWNSLQKLCVLDPKTYIRCFANPAVDAACEAWLGPDYQMTTQVNIVYPGGDAQFAHRDYHLGFQVPEVAANYPAHVHELSPLMTLQGAIAHCDMPIESGPTKLLPFSQQYKPGYMVFQREDFRDHFEKNYIQLPLNKGDALFFNPALFHAAGANTSQNIDRLANLMQISSPFGRALEAVDRVKMCKSAYSQLKQLMDDEQLNSLELQAVLRSTAECYSFPTNLDTDPPEGGWAPESQRALMERALSSGWSQNQFFEQLDAQHAKKTP